MGQKINPIAFRMGITQGWRSRWYTGKKNFGNWLVEDYKVREFIRKEYGFAGIARVDIERIGEKVIVTLSAARPGLIIGKRGAKVDKLSEDVGVLVGRQVDVDVKELETPELNAQIVAEAIAEQLQKRAPYRQVGARAALEGDVQALRLDQVADLLDALPVQGQHVVEEMYVLHAVVLHRVHDVGHDDLGRAREDPRCVQSLGGTEDALPGTAPQGLYRGEPAHSPERADLVAIVFQEVARRHRQAVEVLDWLARAREVRLAVLLEDDALEVREVLASLEPLEERR